MASYFLRKITDYWDENAGAVHVRSRELAALGAEERTAAVATLGAAVREHARVLSDTQLVQAGLVMSEDLYRAASFATIWDWAVAEYLAASAGTLCKCLRDRRYLIRYAIDNQYDGLTRPVKLFRAWFRAAGFTYLCPQAFAADLMEHEGLGRDAWRDHMPRHIEEARRMAAWALEKPEVRATHVVYLDADAIDGTFDAALGSKDAPGVLTIFRHAAPGSGSKSDVWFPDQPMAGV